jgi:3-phosphoshikimate 1-carboxyvinyltransferase
MKTIVFTPTPLTGELDIITSKSYAHRALIVSSLAKGCSEIINMPYSEDVYATQEALKHFGVSIKSNRVESQHLIYDQSPIDCFASGSTLRMLIPIAMALFDRVIFSGIPRLFERPLDVYETLFKNQIKRLDKEQIEVRGPITDQTFHVDGSKSSQFVSGLLMMSPLLNKDVEIKMINEISSESYIEMTIEIMKHFGVAINKNNHSYFIHKGQNYQPSTITIEGDYSQAAFFLVAGLIGKPIHVKGILPNSKQGDQKIIDILIEMGGNLRWTDEGIVASPSYTKGIHIDLKDIPDLGPILMILAALSKGKTRFSNVERLKYKESDRLNTMIHILHELGVKTYYEDDELTIEGGVTFKGHLTFSSEDDHRIAMAIAIASIRAEGNMTLTHAEAVKKSYPEFYDVFQSLGGHIYES